MPRAAPANIRALARLHTRLAVNTLAGICNNSKNDNARVAAADILLKRGWGSVTPDDDRDGTLQITIRNIFERDPALKNITAVIEHSKEEQHENNFDGARVGVDDDRS